MGGAYFQGVSQAPTTRGQGPSTHQILGFPSISFDAEILKYQI